MNEGDRDCKKLRAIHDWLVKRITYTKGNTHSHDIYGAIAEGECVCEGYAKAFSYICHLYGFDCLYIKGFTYSSSTVGHAWNLVYGEGAWYFVDVTWDDDERYSVDHDYFMVGSDTKIGGKKFSTENHMADNLYGITSAKDKFVDPEQEALGMFLFAAIVLGVLGYMALKIYKRRKLRRMYPSPYADTGSMYIGRHCVCGEPVHEELEFCPRCGMMYRR